MKWKEEAAVTAYLNYLELSQCGLFICYYLLCTLLPGTQSWDCQPAAQSVRLACIHRLL